MNIGIYIYCQAEVLDFSGPFEVFSTASRICNQENPFNVFLVSETNEPVKARGGFSVNANYNFENHPPIDVLIIPGGVHVAELENIRTIEWVKHQANKAKVVSSVCTGAFILAKAELISGKKVTTHWEDIVDLRNMFPTLQVVENVRWVKEGNLVTSGGISAGIDMSLYLVSQLHSDYLAEKTATQMEFNWTKKS